MVILSSEEFRNLDKNKKYTKKFTALNNISKAEKSYIKPLLGLKSALKDDDIIGFIEKNIKIVACMFAEKDTHFSDKNIQCKEWSKNGECKKNPDYMLNECRLSCRKLKYKNYKQPIQTLYMYNTYVDPKYRGKSLCSMLTKEFIKKFGDHVIYLNLMKNNLSNINCRTKNDFIILPESGSTMKRYKETYTMVRIPNKSIKKRKKSKRR